ncbi:DUF1028 domain-containing protein [Arthrobacter rhombi]|uniref:DUF1028 domain-containing protein n=1 Tax=Arthrobacter rhombi TaxID=71253 RepID=UPI003FD641AB
MTFSILARDAHGGFGLAVTSSSPCVAARCLHLRHGIGGVASQNITDPRYGKQLLDALAAGNTAERALERLVAADATSSYRQICVIGDSGAPAVHSGEHTLGVNHTAMGQSAVAAGNLLSSQNVVDEVLAAFEAAAGELETRLLVGLEAGLAAGGEAGDLRSAGLAVVRDVDWNSTDLRVDWHESPITELNELLGIWLPERDNYVVRGIDPSLAPAYGVPGDE